ncbi:hypothetical protein AMECASPLE_009821 [Ameca splendens]|uniref:Uncharacterized protein n=1 Tax=Ameca splendens TaxID=208324 RepID=A0ABV0YMD5_9TELE
MTAKKRAEKKTEDFTYHEREGCCCVGLRGWCSGRAGETQLGAAVQVGLAQHGFIQEFTANKNGCSYVRTLIFFILSCDEVRTSREA